MYVGEHGGFAGLDQAKVRLPRSLARRSEIDLALTIDHSTANTVKANVK